MSFYPVNLSLCGRRCVVVGGGTIAEQKVKGLLQVGANVTVISPTATNPIRELAELGKLTLKPRRYRRGDLRGAFLAIGTTEDQDLNRRLWRAAERRGVLLNAVDDTPHCHFIAPSIHRQGDLAISISTAGKSPALAVRLRQRIARMIGPEYGEWLDLLGSLRAEIAARVPDQAARTSLWFRIADSEGIEALRRGDVAAARSRIASLVDAAQAAPTRSSRGPIAGSAPTPHGALNDAPSPGIVYLVGAGPGDPGLITVRGQEIVRTCDAVVYDRLVNPAILEQARPEAERIFVGKQPSGPPMSQQLINETLVERARQGLVVARLKGGDPFVFGRGGEECESLARAGVPFEVVSGVTSVTAVPASAGIPVTHRRYNSAFAVLTGHECEGSSDLDWDALARIPTLVILMGLRQLPGIVRHLLAHDVPPTTPAAVVANGTLPDGQTVVGEVATIAQLARAAHVEPPATIIVGQVVEMRDTLLPPLLEEVSHSRRTEPPPGTDYPVPEALLAGGL